MRLSDEQVKQDLKNLVKEIGGFGSGVNGELFAEKAMESHRDPYVQVLARVIRNLDNYVSVLEERIAALEEELEVEVPDELYDSLSEENVKD
jgi:hypothetical protein